VEIEAENGFMHSVAFGEGQTLPHEAGEVLAERAVPALHVVGLATLLAPCTVLPGRQDRCVARPKVAVADQAAVRLRDPLPQPVATRLTAVTQHVGDGLIFQSKRFREACRQYRLTQEYITPYTPEQNGVIERFFRSLKEECVWLRSFRSFAEASRAIREWIRFYNEERPHQALGYQSPSQFRAQQLPRVA
jgi:hypothetical protein